MAPRDGFEPPTNGLTVRRSTTELPGNSQEARIVGKPSVEVKESRVSDDGVRHVGRFPLRGCCRAHRLSKRQFSRVIAHVDRPAADQLSEPLSIVREQCARGLFKIRQIAGHG
jgi:hypothetical protein